MNRRTALSLFAGITMSGASLDCRGSAPEDSEERRIQWVAQTLEQMQRVKPGMRRSDLLTLFTTEGGLSTPLQRTYVSRHCPYFKVDVTFQAVGGPGKDQDRRSTLVEDNRDVIKSISRPYLEFSHLD